MKTNTDTQTQLTSIKITSGFWLPLLALMLVSIASAQTFVPPAPATGHWNTAGSPYYVVDNVSVPSGQTLTLDPGVTVLIGSNLTVTANGSLIQALGTPSQRITIGSQSGSFSYNTISLINAPGTNRFKYCDFTNAQTAVSMGVYGKTQVMPVEFMNCTFYNCASSAIYGEAQGLSCNGVDGSATLQPTIKNCGFYSISNGCTLKIFGQNNVCGPYYGYANPRIVGNIFQNLSGTAFLMQIGSLAGGGSPVFVNNTMVNCRVGTSATDPWDARIQDNIFVGATNAAIVSGSLSRAVNYNDFYQNAVNFTGYPAPYGAVVTANRNGTPSDILFNIFQNPQFVATSDFHLQITSPCINAGTTDDAFANMCVPPSAVTTNFPELGAYGGPDACNWLDVVPKLPAQLSLSRSNNVLRLNWGAIPRSTYSVQYLATNFYASSGTNKWLTNSTVIPSDRPVSMVVSPYPTTNNNGYFRVQSLGRTPGN